MLIIGIIQGLTEFLPISSSGHIVLFGSLVQMDNLLLVSVVAHIGTLFAVILCYKDRLKQLVLHPKNPTNINLILATIPTVIIVVLFNKFFESRFSINGLVWGFLFSAIMLAIADFKKTNSKHFNKTSSIIEGIIQGGAVIPGISRSGATLVGGILMGIDKKECLDFSFLMSIPIIIASAVYEGAKLFTCQITLNWLEIFVVMISSFVFGIISIKLMLKFVKNNRLIYFSFYLIILSLVLLFVF